ncbi:unnamed protein product [Caenorhabditis nigoni]
MTENGGEKKFVIKHVFRNVSLQPVDTMVYGKEEEHFGIFWKLGLRWKRSLNIFGDMTDMIFVHVAFQKSDDVIGSEWSMEFEVDSNLYEISGITNKKYTISEKSEKVIDLVQTHRNNLKQYLVNGTLETEFHVEIKKMSGFKLPKLRNFDDDVAKKFSDICLLAGNQKFYVSKLFLASHSTYFESLFLGNFEESQKQEIKLENIDSVDFQNFLELINGETFVNDDTVEGLLHLADFFDSKTVFRRCEGFMMNKSEKSLKLKFELAIKYRLEPLKKKCISGMKNKEDVKSVLPEDPFQINQDVWAELFNKAVSFN